TNRNGRVYILRNGSTSNNALTFKATGSESINTGILNSNTLLLHAGHSVIIARNNMPGGGTNPTWNVISYGEIKPFSTVSTSVASLSAGNAVAITGANNSPATAVTINRYASSTNLMNDLYL